MLSSFFSSSKPIHHVIFIGLLLAGLLSTYFTQSTPITLAAILWGFTLIITAGIYQFIISRNELTRPHAFASFISVVLLLSLLPDIYGNSLLFTLFFILLGLRRLLSLRSGMTVTSKIFDASFWLTWAAVLTPGAFLYLILIFLAILFYAPSDYRHWLTPFLGIFSAAILALVAHLYIPDLVTIDFNALGISMGSWNSFVLKPVLIIPLFIIIASMVFMINYLAGVLSLQQRVLPRFTVLAFYTIITFILLILQGTATLIENCLLLIPIAALCTAQVAERVPETLYKELIIGIPLVLAVISVFIG
jgi:hypothetical protein